LPAGVTLATRGAVRALGFDVLSEIESSLRFQGGGLREPAAPLDCVNAGTCMRLLAGALVGQTFPSVLDGSPQLRRRPMARITGPLRAMGASISDTDGRAPLHIEPAPLHGHEHTLSVASAQVKSAILLAGLHAEGATVVHEPGPSRNHTEVMLQAIGADLKVDKHTVHLAAAQPRLEPLELDVPGDISSAAFVLVAAACLPGSDVVIEHVGLNPTRTGILEVLARMGSDVASTEREESGGEPLGTLRIRGGDLSGVSLGGDLIVRAIDELPVIAVAAAQAAGETRITDAAELRVKEVDRIAVVAQELRKLGVQVSEQPDGLVVEGGHPLKGTAVDSHGDHRIGMMLAVAGLFAEGETHIQNAGCIADSFPGFAATLAALGAEVRTA
ncbi:MAG: 3-phosphoshikimate 1-carboxyvinyltransferase, partial [Anaerolineae bacterium]